MVHEEDPISTKCNRHSHQSNAYQIDDRERSDKELDESPHDNDRNHNQVIVRKMDDKQLSFSNGDDEYDTADESSSQDDLQQKPISKKWSSIIDGDVKDGDENNKNPPLAKTMTKTITACEEVNEDEDDTAEVVSHHDDASSTSSCSCEDHSSVMDASEDPHEALDYDEDSITNSPAGASNTLTQDPSSSSSMKDASKIVSPSPEDRDLYTENLSHESEKPSGSSTDANSSTKSSSDRAPPKARIRSVINFDHAKERVSSIESEKNDSRLDGGDQKSYECLLRYFFRDACYFQIKSINYENVALSKSLGVWSTPIQNELRLNKAFQEHRNVILIFSVQQSGGFQGFARMISESGPSTKPVPWILPERLSRNSLGGVFKVQWLNTKELPFTETQDLFNPYNENKPVKVARDGQQVESRVGKKLCRLFPHDSRKRLLSSLSTLKYQTSQRKKMPHRRDDLYPLVCERAGPFADMRYREESGPMRMVMDGIDPRALGFPGHMNDGFNVYNSSNHRSNYKRRFYEHIGEPHYDAFPGGHFPMSRSHPMHRAQRFMPRFIGSPNRGHNPSFQAEPMFMQPINQNNRFPLLYDPYPGPAHTNNRYHPYQRGKR